MVKEIFKLSYYNTLCYGPSVNSKPIYSVFITFTDLVLFYENACMYIMCFAYKTFSELTLKFVLTVKSILQMP